MRIVIFFLTIFILPISAQENILELEPSSESYGNADWLLDASSYKAGVYRSQNGNEIVLSNGLIRRAFIIAENAACIAFDNLINQESIMRGVKPEAEITINGISYPIGGLKGQPNYAYLNPAWIDSLVNDVTAFQFINYEISKPAMPFQWKRVRHHQVDAAWPPKGIDGQPLGRRLEDKDVMISIHYELYDGIPVMAKWMTVHNNSDLGINIDHFTSEIIAAIEYMSLVENRGILSIGKKIQIIIRRLIISRLHHAY